VSYLCRGRADESIAQALSAASQTIKAPLGLHSQHCYFLLPADASIPIDYEVERLRDGKSYANRLVKAIQRDKPVFILAASYTLPPIELPKSPKVPDSGAKEALSHSLRFALGNASESGQDDRRNEKQKQKQKETDDIQSPFGFLPKFQIEFPDDVMGYEECEQEESRWAKFLKEKAELDGRGQRAIGEYIRVGTIDMRVGLADWIGKAGVASRYCRR
jgi:acyl-CoA thioesterase 8